MPEELIVSKDDNHRLPETSSLVPLHHGAA
ncbi:MAG: hypothetical protein QOD56_2231 [Gammaproteobacteria bacterium]|jgi:hypothetical protein|nr:hypothetical protein [Gammaproteobacteria bacterium]